MAWKENYNPKKELDALQHAMTVNIVPNVSGGSTIASGITAPTTDFEGIPFVPTDSIKIGEKKW